jgi:hypothetical protein
MVMSLAAVTCAVATQEEVPLPPDPGGGSGVGASGSGSDFGGTSGKAGGASTAFGGSAGTPASGKGGSAGNLSGGKAGSFNGNAGATASGGSDAGFVGCPDPKMPMNPGDKQGDSGSFATLEAVCYFVEGSFNNWACSNLGGRSVSVNGMPFMMCGGALPPAVDGGYYFMFGESATTDYTSFYWYTS